VDDGSADNSIEVLSQQFPQIRLVKHEINQGFAEAVHSGVSAAETEILIFLNSDVQCQADFILPLVQHLRDANVFSVSPLIRRDNGDIHHSTLNCYQIQWGRLRKTREDWGQLVLDAPRYSLYASGGSMALRKPMFAALGGFLPIFKPFYGEDFDLGLRAWRRGWRTVVEPASVIVHQDHGSILENFAKRKVRRALQRNKLIVEWLHIPANILLPTLLPRLLLRIIAKLLIADVGHLQAVHEAITRVPEVLKLRKQFAEQNMTNFAEVLQTIKQENIRLQQAKTTE
jgi:GT2 family glycosyltransferase